jgi:hypothetical protein
VQKNINCCYATKYAYVCSAHADTWLVHACYHYYLHLLYSAGYIAAYSVLASGDVDLCLVPEVEVKLHGPTVS